MIGAVSIVCFLVLLFLILSFFRSGTDVLAPGRLFLIVWTTSIGLADLKLSRHQIDWSFYSWFALFLPIISTLVGIFAIYVLNFSRSYITINEIRNKFTHSNINGNRLFRIILLMVVLYFVSFSITYMIRGFLPIFTKMPEIARTKWGVFGYGVFVLSIPTIVYLSLIYLFLTKQKKTKKLFILIITLFTAITYSTLLQRFYLLMPIIISLILFYYITHKLRPKNVLIILIIFFFIFYGISSIRLSRYAINILYYLSNMKYSIDYAIFTEPYMYISMNLENFANGVDKLNVYAYGFFTFDFLLFATRLKPLILEYIKIPDFPHIITPAYNTYTMFFIYYRDFGLVGLFFLPFILGTVVSSFYYRMRRNPNINTITIYALCVVVVIFSFFIPIVHWIHFVFNIILLYSTTRMITGSGNGESK